MSRRPVLFDKRPILFAGFAACLVSLLTSCANSSTGKALERSFAADPNLKDNPTILGGSSQKNQENQESAQLPEDFPTEIPRYPEAKLENVEQLTVPTAQGLRTIWSSSDPINAIQRYYQKEFESNNWQIVSQPTDESGGTLVARLNDLQVTVSIPSSAPSSNSRETPSSSQPVAGRTSASGTQFDIQYIRNNGEVASQPTGTEPAKPAEPSDSGNQPAIVPSASSQNFTDLDKLPQELRQHIEDLVALGVLTLDPSSSKNTSGATGTQFQPNKAITRREFARWLVAANNRIYANRPGLQIRFGSETSQPAFQDVPRSHPDFQSIQGLAEAGLIPSPLSGDSTAVLFRPDAPLTRENLLLWKVPLDIRQALPAASLDAVKQTWGFQDVGKIDPKALRAVLADFQNGDQSNIRRVFGYTTLFQPKKPVTRAEAAAAIWYLGSQGEGISAKEAQQLKSQPSKPSTTSEPAPSSSPSP